MNSISLPQLWREVDPTIPRQTFNNRIKAMALRGEVTIIKKADGRRYVNGFRQSDYERAGDQS